MRWEAVIVNLSRKQVEAFEGFSLHDHGGARKSNGLHDFHGKMEHSSRFRTDPAAMFRDHLAFRPCPASLWLANHGGAITGRIALWLDLSGPSLL
jgi:hypothetical protein